MSLQLYIRSPTRSSCWRVCPKYRRRGSAVCVAGLTVVGGLVSAMGSVMGAMAQKQVADYNAKVAEINAESANIEAGAQAGQTLDEFAELGASQRAAIGKSGADPSSGTAMNIAFDTEKKRQYAFQTDLWRGHVESTKWKNQAKLYEAEGKSAMTSGLIGGFSGLLSGVSGMSGGLGQGQAIGLGAAPAAPALAPAGATTVPIPRPKPRPYILGPGGLIVGGI